MRNIPFPLFDIAPCLKNHPERTDVVMRKMQEFLQRNSNGLKRTNGQGFRLQHGLLLSSTHQLVDKLVSETQDTMSLRAGSSDSAVQRLIEDAENSKQLLPKLQEAVRCEPHPIEVKLSKVATELSHNIRGYLEVSGSLYTKNERFTWKLTNTLLGNNGHDDSNWRRTMSKNSWHSKCGQRFAKELQR